MSAIVTTAVVYALAVANTADRQKFQAGSRPYQPSRIVSCPLNDYGRPQGCSATTTGRFANPYANHQSGEAVTMKDEPK